jgi:hypothetical protein
MLELVRGERGRALGPITRARALCIALSDGQPPAAAVALAREAVALDPASPVPWHALTRSLERLREADPTARGAPDPEEVAAAARRSVALFAPYIRRSSITRFERLVVGGTALCALARTGHRDEARALLEQVRARDPDALELDGLAREVEGAPDPAPR